MIISRVEPEIIWKFIEDRAITHLCAAPTVLVNLSSVPNTFKRNLELKKKLTIFTGGAPPAPKVIENIETLGAEVVHLYGLTETYGPSTLCLWKSEWNGLPDERRSCDQGKTGSPAFERKGNPGRE